MYIDTIITAIATASADAQDYSTPGKVQQIPFPFIGAPHGRFHMEKQNGINVFRYGGREVFQQLHDQVSALKYLGGHTYLQLYGTIGYGKSHVLAALAVLLMRLGEKRVVYVPDCKKMLVSPGDYMKQALLLALKLKPLDTEPEAAYAALQECEGPDDIQRWKRARITEGDLLFFVGQVSSLDPKGASALHDLVKVEQCRTFLNNMYTGQLVVEESSANNEQAHEDNSSQSRPPRVSCYGGLSENEYKASETKKQLQTLTELEREKVEDATGLIPLSLDKFTKCWTLAQQDFAAAWRSFVASEEVHCIDKWLRKMSADQLSWHRETVIKLMLEMVMVRPSESLYDARFFYHKGEQGRSVCGLARDVMAEIVFELDRQVFINIGYIGFINTGNPIIDGFLVERACGAQFIKNGLKLAPDALLKLGSYAGSLAVFIFKTGLPLVTLSRPASVCSAVGACCVLMCYSQMRN